MNKLSKQKLALYLVPTPIGNIQDITMRAIETLNNVDIIACEDTRVTGKLLEFYKINTRMICYNDFSNDDNRAGIINLLDSGKSVALVSDAGTPLISDPGYKLIKEVEKNNYPIVSLPGASSTLTALVASGMPTDKFMFLGFPPSKSLSRKNFLKKYSDLDASLIVFESPRRLISCLKDIKESYPNREIAVLREMTKTFEEKVCGKIDEIINEFERREKVLGEIVIVISSPVTDFIDENEIKNKLEQTIAKMSLKDSVDYVSKILGVKRKVVYKIAIDLNK